KQPMLPDDFADQAAAIDQAVFNKGVAINRDKRLALGHDRFQQLLRRDRTARISQRVVGSSTGLTSWQSVEFACAGADAPVTQVPRRRNSEILRGAGAEREAVARVTGFRDLWKTIQEAANVRDVLAFHDAFKSLVFGQSLLERLSTDQRLRSRWFCGGTGMKVALFSEWLDTLQGEHFSVTFTRPLWHVVAWLAGRTDAAAKLTRSRPRVLRTAFTVTRPDKALCNRL